jgi:hypothetical protein
LNEGLKIKGIMKIICIYLKRFDLSVFNNVFQSESFQDTAKITIKITVFIHVAAIGRIIPIAILIFVP